MRKSCVIHIGSGKTGTSSMQQILFDNGDLLKENHIIYPTSCLWRGDRSHNTLGVYMWDNFYEQAKKASFEETLDQLMGEISDWPHVIISSELLEKSIMHGNRANVIALLDALAGMDYDIDVLYVVRRQDFYIESLFKHAVSDSSSLYRGTVSEFLQARNRYLMYNDIANSWRRMSQVKSVKVIPFLEGASSRNIDTVLQAMGVKEIVGETSQIPAVNLSLEGIYLRLKQWLNVNCSDLQLHRRYVAVVTGNKDARLHEKRTVVFNEDERKRFLKDYEGDLLLLEENFSFQRTFFETEQCQNADKFSVLTDEELDSAVDEIALLDNDLAAQLRRVVADAGRLTAVSEG